MEHFYRAAQPSRIAVAGLEGDLTLRTNLSSFRLEGTAMATG